MGINYEFYYEKVISQAPLTQNCEIVLTRWWNVSELFSLHENDITRSTYKTPLFFQQWELYILLFPFLPYFLNCSHEDVPIFRIASPDTEQQTLSHGMKCRALHSYYHRTMQIIELTLKHRAWLLSLVAAELLHHGRMQCGQKQERQGRKFKGFTVACFLLLC